MTIRELFDDNLVKYPYHLYSLKEKDLVFRFGKNGLKCFDSIERKKTLSLPLFLASLGIKKLGRSTAKTITKDYSSLKEFLALTFDQLIKIKGIERKSANHILNGRDRIPFNERGDLYRSKR